MRVPTGGNLQINEGTNVYFHKKAKLTLSEGSTLSAQGSLDKMITFRGERNDTAYDTIPKNWEGIYVEKNATAKFNFAKIMGGTVGISAKKADVQLRNTILHTFDQYGVYSVASALTLENVVMNNCGISDVSFLAGGQLSIKHTTLANYLNFNAALPGQALYINPSSVEGLSSPFSAQISNSVLWNASNAMKVENITPGSMNLQNCLLKYEASAAGFTPTSAMQLVLNQDPLFMHTGIRLMNLRVKANSPAKGKGNVSVAQSLPLDIVNVNRTNSPTLGAYQ